MFVSEALRLGKCGYSRNARDPTQAAMIRGKGKGGWEGEGGMGGMGRFNH